MIRDERKRMNRRNHASAGYNIVEVLIAVAILGVVAISISALFFIGRKNVYSGKQASQAVVIGTQVLEDLSPLSREQIYNASFGIAATATGDDFTLPRVSGVDAMEFENSRIRSTDANILPSPPADIQTQSTPPAFLTKWQNAIGNKLDRGSVTVIMTPTADPTNSPAQFGTAQVMRVRVIVRWNETGRWREAIWDTLKSI